MYINATCQSKFSVVFFDMRHQYTLTIWDETYNYMIEQDLNTIPVASTITRGLSIGSLKYMGERKL